MRWPSGLDRQLGGTVALEVASEGRGLLADFTEVNGPSALGEEQETIETLEEHGGRLVDSAENSLAVLGQSINEIENRPRSLTVQTRRRLIEKEKQLGLGCQLNTNGETLPLLNVQTC